MLADLAEATRRATRAWPVEEGARRVTDVRCPACGCLSLEIIPPAVEGADVQVRCVLQACGLVLTEEDWDRARQWELMLARQEKERVG